MKYYSLTLLILMLVAQLAVGQTNPPVSKLIYKISLTDSSVRQTKGYLLNLTDTTVRISNHPVRFASDAAIAGSLKEVSYPQITEIQLKRKHGALRGMWKGAIIGVLIGVAAGFIEGDDPVQEYDPWDPYYYLGVSMTATDKAVAYGVLGGALGTGIGALIGGLAKKKFVIGGKKEKFDEMKANVLTKAYGRKMVNGEWSMVNGECFQHMFTTSLIIHY